MYEIANKWHLCNHSKCLQVPHVHTHNKSKYLCGTCLFAWCASLYVCICTRCGFSFTLFACAMLTQGLHVCIPLVHVHSVCSWVLNLHVCIQYLNLNAMCAFMCYTHAIYTCVHGTNMSACALRAICGHS